ncbi:uncharacterized protein [Halyomorpha halys]|uniref:uncharacterized protein n=1 Tax=Halyomorpha halys TaxID=286706 RepID=UPI0006D4E23C|nr:uncharacterized protein LOC106685921 [Halyomorpha halys]
MVDCIRKEFMALLHPTVLYRISKSNKMPWPALLLCLLAFLTSRVTSYPEFPSLSYQETTENDDQIPDLEETFEAKRALTLLSKLVPIRKVLRQQDDRHYDSRAFRPRWSNNINERAPGPLRWGRRR